LPGEPSVTPGPLARALLADPTTQWRTVERPNVSIHLLTGTQADTDAIAIADSVVAIRNDLLRHLEISIQTDSAAPADIFFVDGRETMQRIAGRPLMGFVQHDEPTGVFLYMRDYNTAALLRHELTHLYTFQYWGSPRAGAWLVEGVAIWQGGLCQGYSPDELAAGVLRSGAFVTLTVLAHRFRELPEDVAMPEAGSITEFLFAREGVRGIRSRWARATDGEGHPLGRDGPELEATWMTRLRRARPAVLDIPRMMSRGC
jgi:hypothetical protein